MNVRKNIDYSQMYEAIDAVMVQKLPQMQLYTAIGKIVCSRSEKGAAVMASEHVRAYYPDVQGFSPRNLRRMRDFYRMYEDEPRLLSIAMELNWTQNIVILEADLTMVEREWYLKTGCLFGWSKLELIEKIISGAHLEMVLDIAQETCDTVENGEEEKASLVWANVPCAPMLFIKRMLLQRCRGRLKRGGIMAYHVFTDIHGEADRSPSLLEKIQFLSEDTLYILGDVVNCVQDWIELFQKIMNVNMVTFLGNYEHMCSNTLDEMQPA